MLKVQVEPHVNRYEPGSEARVKIAVTDHEGIPVSGDVALAAYDESVLAIQPEVGIGPKEILLATKTLEPSDSWRQFYSSLGEHQFDSSGDFVCPEYALALEKFHGPWTATDRSVEDEAKEVLFTGFCLRRGRFTAGDFTPSPSSVARSSRSAPIGESKESLDDTSANARRQFVQPIVRRDYSATATWLPKIQLDDRGQAEVKFRLPDSLTSWRLRAYSITAKTQLGDGTGTCRLPSHSWCVCRRPGF